MQPVGGGQTLCQGQAARWGVVQQFQDLADGNGPRAGRRHTADAVVPGRRFDGVVKTQRLAYQRLVASQVLGAQGAGVAGVALHLAGDGLGHLTLQQCRRPLVGDALQHRSQLRVAQHMADGPGLASRVVKIGGGHRVFLQVRLAGQQRGHARADGKTLCGQRDGRAKQLRPRQAPVLLVCQCQHGYCTRNAHRATADNRICKLEGLAAVVQKQPRCGAGRGGLAAVKGLRGLAVKVQQKGPTANAAALWLHQGQHHLYRDGCVHRAATGAQHLLPGVGGQRVGGGHSVTAGGPARLGGAAGGAFGLQGYCVLPSGGGAGAARQCGNQKGKAGPGDLTCGPHGVYLALGTRPSR